MLVLSLARGAYFQTMYGDLSLLNSEDAAFFGKTQKLYNGMYPYAKTSLFGGIPGKGEVFGYLSESNDGQLITVCNPSQNRTKVAFPDFLKTKKALLLFADSGYTPLIENGTVSLGAEQLAVIGFGKYAQSDFTLGKGDNVLPIPNQTEKIPVQFASSSLEISGSFVPKQAGRYRLLFQQFKKYNIPLRSTGGGKPGAKSLGEINKIQVLVAGKPIKPEIQYDKIIWSGLSWAAAEWELQAKNIGEEVLMKYTGSDGQIFSLTGELYLIS
jgi:hypothetical protein